MSRRSHRRQGRGRAVAVSNGTLAAVLVTVLAVVALVVHPPSPPGIAEFAPQASKPITKAPPGQAAIAGEGPGACVAGQDCAAAPRPTAPPPRSSLPPRTGIPSALQCHVWPDGSVTQTYDRQSPPCIASWDERRGNGGATAMGVTRTTIRVAGACPAGNGGLTCQWVRPLINFINSHYQLYGRKLVYDFVPDPRGSGDRPSKARAHAVQIAARKPFAGLGGSQSRFASEEFATTLARRRVLHVVPVVRARITSELLRRHAPYLWSVSAPIDVAQRTTGAFTCRTLAGRSARYAGEELRSKPRKFVVASYSYDGIFDRPPEPEPLVAVLRACGAPVKTVQFAPAAPGSIAAQAMQLSREGWTTILWNDYALNMHSVMGEFRTYEPEWVPVGFIDEDEMEYSWQPDSAAQAGQQLHRLFGPWPYNKLLNAPDTPSRQAYQDGGGSPRIWTGTMQQTYRALTLLAAGIQMAGPHLAPGTFQAGLHATRFPNPQAAAQPDYQAHVGFTDGDYTLSDDFALVWWNPQRRGKTGYSDSTNGAGGLGTWCFFGRGQRFAATSWPTSDERLKDSVDCD